METTGGHLSPSDLPLPDMDNMYKILLGTPVTDDVSMQTSPLHTDDSVFLTWRKSMPMGSCKNITPESLVPYSMPVQPHKYCHIDSTPQGNSGNVCLETGTVVSIR